MYRHRNGCCSGLRVAVEMKRIAGYGLILLAAILSSCQSPSKKEPTSSGHDALSHEALKTVPAEVLPSEKQNPHFIALGPIGQSRTFKSLITLFKHRSDTQPPCVGCSRLRLVIDDKAKPADGATGPAPDLPLAHSAAWNVTAQCPGAKPPRREPLSSIWRKSWSPREVQLTLAFDPGKCNGQVATLELYADTCNSPNAECSKPAVRHSFAISLTAINALTIWLDDAYPNLTVATEGSAP